MTISATTQGLRMGVATSTSRPTVPFDGQVISETDTDSLQVYKGTAWAPVSSLQYITGASFSAASTVSFAADTFTSTYDNYRVMLNITSASANSNVRLRFRAAGVDNSTSNYAVAGKGRSYAGANVDYDSASDTGCYLYATSVAYGLKTIIDIFGPKLAQSTSVTNFANGASSTGADGYITMGNIFGLTTSFDSATIFATSGTITGNYKVYGYSNS